MFPYWIEAQSYTWMIFVNFIQHITAYNTSETVRLDGFIKHFLANLNSFDISKQQQETMVVYFMISHRLNSFCVLD